MGLAAFVMDTAAGVVFAKLLNLFLRDCGPAPGISAFPGTA